MDSQQRRKSNRETIDLFHRRIIFNVQDKTLRGIDKDNFRSWRRVKLYFFKYFGWLTVPVARYDIVPVCSNWLALIWKQPEVSACGVVPVAAIFPLSSAGSCRNYRYNKRNIYCTEQKYMSFQNVLATNFVTYIYSALFTKKK